MVTIPTGSIIGIAALALIVGIVIGRSGRVMGKIGRAHAAAHGGSAAGGNARTGDQRVSQVVVVAGDGSAPGPAAVEHAVAVVDRRTAPGVTAGGSAVRGELVEADSHDLTGWGDWHESSDAEVVA